MYAIIEVGAKQYQVKKGDIIEVEKLTVIKDKEITFDQVLLISSDDKVEVGTPYLKSASVKAQVLGDTKGEKKVSYKYRRRKAFHWKKGHRQKLTCLKITDVKG